ncbi:MAG: S9 family peptidase, partial [Spirochaetota bacterium]
MGCRTVTAVDLNPSAPSPPRAERREHERTIHGQRVCDPYYWLRDPEYPEVTDESILRYLSAENDYFRAVLEPHSSRVESLLRELRDRIEEKDASVPVRDGEYYYQSRFEPGDEYRTHHRRPVGSHSWQLILDERAMAEGHDYFDLGGMDVSDDGILVCSTDTQGDERYTITFRDLATGETLPDSIHGTIGEPVWLPGARTVLYLELSEEWRPFRVRAHRLGTPTASDPVLYEEPEAGFFVDVDLSQDREFVLITTGDHETSEVRAKRVSEPVDGALTVISPRRTGHEYHVDHARDRFFILTNDVSVNFRLVSVSDARPGESEWEELVAGRPDVYIRGFTPFSTFLLLEERASANDRIAIVSYEGKRRPVVFPEELYAAHEGENPEFDVSVIQLRYESMITPPTVYDYDVNAETLTERKVASIPSGYDRSRYRTQRIDAPTRDGTSVPVSIVYRDDFPLDGTGYLHLYAYGAYGYGTPPGFSRNQLSLLDRGFAFAIAHVRGGDDLGYGWYLDGKLMKRRNTFNDFIDAARSLVGRRYTAEGRICITGGSAGGELIGVVLNEAPELWGAAVAHVPFVDVTNTMLDDTLPLTPMEWPEWGNPIEDPAAFE